MPLNASDTIQTLSFSILLPIKTYPICCVAWIILDTYNIIRDVKLEWEFFPKIIQLKYQDWFLLWYSKDNMIQIQYYSMLQHVIFNLLNGSTVWIIKIQLLLNMCEEQYANSQNFFWRHSHQQMSRCVFKQSHTDSSSNYHNNFNKWNGIILCLLDYLSMYLHILFLENL